MEQKGIRVITCNYCKKQNHIIKECRKPKHANERKTQEQQGTSSGNGSTPGPSGARPVGEIKTAILNLLGLSISRQN